MFTTLPAMALPGRIDDLVPKMSAHAVSHIIFFSGLMMVQSIWIAIREAQNLRTAWSLVLIPTYVMVARVLYNLTFRVYYGIDRLRLVYGFVATAGVLVSILSVIGAVITLVLVLDTDDTPSYVFWIFAAIASGSVFVGWGWIVLELVMGACSRGCRIGVGSLSAESETVSQDIELFEESAYSKFGGQSAKTPKSQKDSEDNGLA